MLFTKILFCYLACEVTAEFEQDFLNACLSFANLFVTVKLEEKLIYLDHPSISLPTIYSPTRAFLVTMWCHD